MKKVLNAQLGFNYMTEEPNDYTAFVITNGSVNMDDLIQSLREDGMEIKAETAKDVVTRFNKKAADLALSGYNVNTGLVYMRPVIKGVFLDNTWDPEKHSVYVVMNQGADLRAALAETEVKILGEKGDAIQLFSIIDTTTGNTEGKLTKGRTAEIKGAMIKIAGNSDETGLFFTNIETREAIKLPSEFIVLNERSRMMILVPDTLTAGEYELSVVTQYSKSTKLLKTPRRAILPVPIVIE
jgi:hypothetical protein